MGERRYNSTAVHFPNGNDLNQSIPISYNIFLRAYAHTRVHEGFFVGSLGGVGGSCVAEPPPLALPPPCKCHEECCGEFGIRTPCGRSSLPRRALPRTPLIASGEFRK